MKTFRSFFEDAELATDKRNAAEDRKDAQKQADKDKR